MGDRGGVPGEVAEALARGATVLTGKQRAARGLQRALDRSNRAVGLGSWTPARIFSWDAWTAGLWHRLVLHGIADRMLLNRTQERTLWIEAIEADPQVSTLRSAGSLAALAAEAWSSLARYGGLTRLRGSATNSDTEAFARWASTFESRCRDHGYLPQARLEDAIRRVWRENPDSLPAEREILLLGFDCLLPAQQILRNDLQASGCVIHESATASPAARRGLMDAPDEVEERLAAATWAREVVEEHPEARVAILVPGLKDSPLERTALDRVLRAVLAPEAQAITNAAKLPYEFSTGVPLDRTGIAATALTLLGWTQQPMALDALGVLLLSHYFAGGTERSARAEFDGYELRKKTMLRPELSLDEFVTLIERSDRREALRQTLVCLRRMQAVIRRLFGTAEHKSYADWAEHMRELLAAAAWAPGGALDSLEFQTRDRWESSLDELATLDFQGERVLSVQALDALRAIAEATTFAPESSDAPVQVMGPEEAAGSRFDAVWMMRTGDLSWPAATPGNPLLPWPLRRELAMPGSNASSDAEQSRRVTERISASCEQVIFSYARQTANGRQRASSVLSSLGLEEHVPGPNRPTATFVHLETVEDAVRLPVLPHPEIPGGVSVLKAQAACAFHAFAQHRLFATELEPREPGMNASERGIAVHGTLENFWAEVNTQAALKAMTSADREATLRRAIETTLQKMKIRESTVPWDKAYLEAQRSRLLALGLRWLDIESARATPFTVMRRESEEKNVIIGPLRLSLRLDRLDATEDGSAILIDYKTGSVSAAAAWSGDRPDEPQLPLYAALSGEKRLHAVVFAMVRAGDAMKLTGYAEKPGTLTVRPVAIETGSLEDEVARWRDVLDTLATSFAAGEAGVSPKSYPATCTYCAHRLICRLDAATLQADEGDEDSTDDDLG